MLNLSMFVPKFDILPTAEHLARALVESNGAIRGAISATTHYVELMAPRLIRMARGAVAMAFVGVVMDRLHVWVKQICCRKIGLLTPSEQQRCTAFKHSLWYIGPFYAIIGAFLFGISAPK